MIEKINKEIGTTVLMITHNSAIADMAHSVYKLRSGEITEIQHNSELVAAERIVSA